MEPVFEARFHSRDNSGERACGLKTIGWFADDLSRDGQAFGGFVRSSVAHAVADAIGGDAHKLEMRLTAEKIWRACRQNKV